MTRQTQKYLAACTQAKALAIRAPQNLTNDVLYQRLEEKGYWWNQQQWTNAPRPRSKRIEMDGAGANPDLIEFRVTAQGDKVEFVTAALKEMAKALGWFFIQQSGGYENREQDGIPDGSKRIRVYSSFIAPEIPDRSDHG